MSRRDVREENTSLSRSSARRVCIFDLGLGLGVEESEWSGAVGAATGEGDSSKGDDGGER